MNHVVEVKNISNDIIDALGDLRGFEITGLLLGEDERYDLLEIKVGYLNDLLQRRSVLMKHVDVKRLSE